MCPSDSYTAPALVEMLWSYGIKEHVCIIQRGDYFLASHGIFMLFEWLWKAKGGDFIGKTIRYNETSSDFSYYLAVADQQISETLPEEDISADTIGGILLSWDEIASDNSTGEGLL